MLYSMNKSDLTTSQAAARLSVGKSTVNLWCRQGRFPGAYAREEARGNVWYIPESDVEKFDKPKMGRPPKVKAEVLPVGNKPKRATKKGSKK
jgi:excisionase family DNA binding protein